MVLDPDRDLQRIHSLIFTNMPRLETLMNACECQAVYGASDICVIPDGGSPIEDVPSCFKTLNALREAAYALQREHRAYFRRLARDTKYGSKYVVRLIVLSEKYIYFLYSRIILIKIYLRKIIITIYYISTDKLLLVMTTTST